MRFNSYMPSQNLSNIDRSALEKALAKFQVQPVGSGFDNLIVAPERADGLIAQLTLLGVSIDLVGWWCLCLPERMGELGCPHGIGGPKNRFGDGWFSECVHLPDFVVPNNKDKIDLSYSLHNSNNEREVKVRNAIAQKYLSDILPQEPFFSECLHYGFWLLVPPHWKRKTYFV